MAAMAAILKIYFFASSPEPMGQLTCNLVGSIVVIRRSKIAKIVPIGNPRWGHLENLFFTSSSEPNDQLACNLIGSIEDL